MANILRIKDKVTQKWQSIIALKGEKGDPGSVDNVSFSDIKGNARDNADLEKELEALGMKIIDIHGIGIQDFSEEDYQTVKANPFRVVLRRNGGEEEINDYFFYKGDTRSGYDFVFDDKRAKYKGVASVYKQARQILISTEYIQLQEDYGLQTRSKKIVEAINEVNAKQVDVVDEMIEGDMRPITSNAVYKIVGMIEERLSKL